MFSKEAKLHKFSGLLLLISFFTSLFFGQISGFDIKSDYFLISIIVFVIISILHGYHNFTVVIDDYISTKITNNCVKLSVFTLSVFAVSIFVYSVVKNSIF